jgi:hypothetical protein
MLITALYIACSLGTFAEVNEPLWAQLCREVALPQSIAWP